MTALSGPLSLLILLLFYTATTQASNDTLVHLSYGSFQGAYSSAYNITHFRRIPFAAPPTGVNRFRAPQPVTPIPSGTIYDSNRDFDMCPQRASNGSEDCLYLALYARPWSAPAKKRPVMLFFYGGAFIQGNVQLSLPPSSYPVLNVSDSTDYIAVYSNYRTNAFGLLPGKAVHDDPHSDLNAGLLDQRAALQWIQKHIHHFGGDPENVTIWGQSAGAGSVTAQLLAESQRPLFKRAIVSSPFWPRNYRYDAPEAEAVYSSLLNLTSCADLACLKTLPVQTILDANAKLNTVNQYTTTSYVWAPVLDDVWLKTPLSRANRVNARAVMGVYNTHEGLNFVTSALNQAASTSTVRPGAFNATAAGFRLWLSGFVPHADERVLSHLETTLYPNTSYTSTQERAGMVYRDVVLACPALWLTKLADQGWIGEYGISPAKHASDTGYWNSVNALQTTQRAVYQGFAGSFAGMIMRGDPNGDGRVWPGVNEGREWTLTESGFGTNGTEALEVRCAYWKGLGRRGVLEI
ncbi:carboxylesterase [Geopyxis carbonaria]|nr:carboxylesterase [Geopyxis carbonaria]